VKRKQWHKTTDEAGMPTAAATKQVDNGNNLG